MRNALQLMVCVALAGSPLAGHAQTPNSVQITDGESLVRDCTPAQDDPVRGTRQLACAAYIAGAADAMVSLMNASKAGSKPFCPPETITYAPIRDAALKYIRDNPGMAKSTAALAVDLVLPQIYPCPK